MKFPKNPKKKHYKWFHQEKSFFLDFVMFMLGKEKTTNQIICSLS